MEEAIADNSQQDAKELSARGELSEWMRYFGVAEEDDDEESSDEML